MNIYFTIIVPIIIINAIIYIIKNNGNPNKKDILIKKYDFSQKSEGKKIVTELSFNQNFEKQMVIAQNMSDGDDYKKKEIHHIHFDKGNKKILILNSLDNLYLLSLYDINLNLLQEINLKLTYNSYSNKISYFTIIENEGEELIIVNYINNYGINYYEFNLKGTIVYQKHISEEKEEIVLVRHNESILNSISNHVQFSYKPISIFSKFNEEIIKVDLLDESLYSEKDWCEFEYIECVTKTNKPNQFAFICTHANYGAQGVKIFEFDNSNNLNLMYDLDDLDFDGAFHNLAFNSSGDKFTVLLYERDESHNDYFSICEYSVTNNKKPLKIFKTNFRYWEFANLNTHYITEILLCIVRNCDLIIYDLVIGKVKEKLKRDFDTAYFIDFNIVIYQNKGKMEVLEY
ncbi:hypothetical protein [Flavobacterium degerlachei]|uniref:Uncharacterized protein n=1 Tax=Flavobacterium degerlachei TaxID=229203 RepID=A0A1H3E903_9FLAO|nr:hypothetical protein [Flavobacterium degerlachei]SDX75080.1 hypothetical protein SAMN05444338_11476 [Flavobacterium degerlachei]